MSDELREIKLDIEKINQTLEDINNKLDKISKKMDSEVIIECQKMGNHIDFIENVYENIKAPLWYVCNKMKYLAGTSNKVYTIDSSNRLFILEN